MRRGHGSYVDTRVAVAGAAARNSGHVPEVELAVETEVGVEVAIAVVVVTAAVFEAATGPEVGFGVASGSDLVSAAFPVFSMTLSLPLRPHHHRRRRHRRRWFWS